MSAARVLWRRLPTYFPNIRLAMYPLETEQLEKLTQTGWLEKAVFRTSVDVGKLEIREFLEKVYLLPVVRVDTTVVQGKKMTQLPTGTARFKAHLTRGKDFKKVWVTFAPGRLTARRE